MNAAPSCSVGINHWCAHTKKTLPKLTRLIEKIAHATLWLAACLLMVGKEASRQRTSKIAATAQLAKVTYAPTIARHLTSTSRRDA